MAIQECLTEPRLTPFRCSTNESYLGGRFHEYTAGQPSLVVLEATESGVMPLETHEVRTLVLISGHGLVSVGECTFQPAMLDQIYIPAGMVPFFEPDHGSIMEFLLFTAHH